MNDKDFSDEMLRKAHRIFAKRKDEEESSFKPVWNSPKENGAPIYFNYHDEAGLKKFMERLAKLKRT
jgi:hypothetical protein